MNESFILKVLLQEFWGKLKHIQGLVRRDAQFPHAPGKIKVAIGMRRAGKTCFLYQKIREMIQEGVPPASILYINFEDDRLLPLDQKKLAQLVDGFYSLYPENHERKCYLFLDEIQNVEGWPLVVRRLHDSKKVEIFLTGSSAKLLSKEIATSLRGRSLAIEVWPYSFTEFMRAKGISIDRSLYGKRTEDRMAQAFQEYLACGGFPEVTLFEADVRQKTLQEYLDVAIYRDIIERHEVKNPHLVKYMIVSMIHNVSAPFSVNKFFNDVKTQGYKIGKDVLYDYADYIEDAYLAFSIPIHSRSVRKAHTQPRKLYAIDPGMIRALTMDYDSNLGRLFENVVYLELRRLGYKVSYYLTGAHYEIDFLVQNGRGAKKLFQVVWDAKDKTTLLREERALQEGMKELKVDGSIVTLDAYLREGISIFAIDSDSSSME